MVLGARTGYHSGASGFKGVVERTAALTVRDGPLAGVSRDGTVSWCPDMCMEVAVDELKCGYSQLPGQTLALFCICPATCTHQ
jgi:hypothetical protein